MRICHVITRLIVGGAQENTLLTCAGLAQHGHAVTLVSGPTHGPEGSLVGRARGDQYEFVELPALVRAVSPRRDLAAARALRALFRERGFDVVHTHSSKAGILGRLAAADAGTPAIVHTIHGMSFNRTQPRIVQAAFAELERLCAARTDRILCVADAMTAAALDAGVGRPDQYETVYSGMQIVEFDPRRHDRAAARARLGLPLDAVVVATVARLFRNKGYELLIPAMQRAARREPRLRFVWIGDGADRPAYEAELARRGLRERTTLTGLVAPEALPGLLAAADLLAHASLWEGLPRAVVQALLMEIPAVCFALDGAPEVVRPGVTGELVAPADVCGLADAIVSLADHPERRAQMGRAGRVLCAARFDWRAMVRQIEAVYERLLADASGASRLARGAT
ncbi:MAG: glycosyltransferase [Phycisphaerae bacterium]